MTVVDWLLDSDPSMRWQVMRDLTDAPADEVAAERGRVAREGAGARLLALQAADGRWGGTAWNHGWNSTMHALWLMCHLGLDPASAEARRAVGLVRDHVTWQGCGPPECDSNPFFAGEVEPCINGQVATAGAYFGQDVRGIVDRLVDEQLSDGGWNCEAANGSTRSSFNTTICVLEALLEHERAGGGTPEVTAARLRGQEYFLERRLCHRRSTGEVIERDRNGGAAWARFAFPTWWHYDVLRGLDYLRDAGVPPDGRVSEAIELVASKRDDDGRWALDTRYPGVMPVDMDEGEGRPSRWNTLRALRVLRWARKLTLSLIGVAAMWSVAAGGPTAPRVADRAATTGPRAWALATTALLTYRNGQRIDALSPGARNDSSVTETRRILRDWWGIDDRAHLLDVLDRLDREGHRAEFQRRARALLGMTDAQYRAKLVAMRDRPQVVRQMKLARDHYRKYGRNSFVGWDYCRYVMLCRWGHMVGFLTEDEAWRRIMPAARTIQGGFASWTDLGGDYLIGRELWSSDETEKSGQIYGDIERWLEKDSHSPWNQLPWRMNLAG